MRKALPTAMAVLALSLMILTSCYSEQPLLPESAHSSGDASGELSQVVRVSAVPAGLTLPINDRRKGLSFPVTDGNAALRRTRSNLVSADIGRFTLGSTADTVQTPSIIWAGNDGSASLWEMNGPSWSGGGATVLQIPAPWRLATAGDLNGDSNPDLIWEATDGTRAVTFMNGGQYAGSYSMMFVIPPEWRIVGCADFDGNAKPDLLLNNAVTGAAGVLFLDGTAWTGVFAPLPGVPTSWRVAAVGDLNADSKPDIVWRDTTGLQPKPIVSLMNGLTPTSTTATFVALPSSAWRVAAIADFDGNAKGDFVLQNLADGSRMIWFMSDGTARLGYLSLPSVPVSQTIVATAPIRWPVENVYFVNTGAPSDDATGWSLIAAGSSPSCVPEPECHGFYQYLGAQFTLASSSYIDLVEGWMYDFNNGAVYVNIRADNANLPGDVVYSKGYFTGVKGPGWFPFSQYAAQLSAGTYWITFEPVSFTPFNGAMPGGAPNPLSRYGIKDNAFVEGEPPWRALNGAAIGVRISGKVVQ